MKLAALAPALFVLISMCGSPVPAPPGSVSGTVYFDANHNRVHDVCDKPLSATVLLTTADGETLSAIPVVNGAFHIPDVPTGDARLTLTSAGDFFWPMTQRTADNRLGVAVAIKSRDETTGIEIASISAMALPKDSDSVIGVVFDDANGNGRPDTDECGLMHAGGQRGRPTQGGITHHPGDGTFEFTRADGGLVFSTLPQGSWKPTTSPDGIDPCRAGTEPTQLSDLPVYEAIIGYARLSTTSSITGTLFDDANENGVRDEGEAAVPRVGVHVTPLNQSCGATVSANEYTDDDGVFRVTGLAPGHYRPTLSGPIGSYANPVSQGWPTTIDLLATSDGSPTIDLPVNVQPSGSIIVSFFSDLDGDGIRGSGEQPVSVEACLSSTGSVAVLPAPESTNYVCKSALGGTATFYQLPLATYAVSVGRMWWPIAVSADVVLSGPEVKTDIALPPLGNDPIPIGDGASMPTTECYSQPGWAQPPFDDGFDPNDDIYVNWGVDESTAREVYRTGFYQASPIKKIDANVWANIAAIDWRLPPSCSSDSSNKTVFDLVGFEPLYGVGLGTIRQVFVRQTAGLFAVEVPLYTYQGDPPPSTPHLVIFVDESGNLIARCDDLGYCERLD